MKNKDYFRKELVEALKRAKKFKGGYSAYGDRSEYLIKLFKSLSNSDEIIAFKAALKDFLLSGNDENIDFIIDVLTDSIEFGNVI